MTTPVSSPSRSCPICGGAADERHRPFCSSRCADRDLNRWLSEVYRVETDEALENFSDESDLISSRGA